MRKILAKGVALPFPHAANRAGAIRLQKRSHTTLLEHCTLVLGRSMAKFEEAVKTVNKEVVNPQRQCSSFHRAEKYARCNN